MNIAGITRFSLSDYPGHVCAVIFTQGCNLRCPYCHNKELIPIQPASNAIPEADALALLSERKGVLNGVVISGGEPTLQQDLARFLSEVQRRGFHVKLDTNGTRPRVIQRLIGNDLLNYIAMDIKAPLHMYGRLGGDCIPVSALKESIATIAQSGLLHEFRTTLMPGLLTDRDVEHVQALVPPGSPHRFNKYREPSRLKPTQTQGNEPRDL